MTGEQLTVATCQLCGKHLGYAGRGRPKKFCSEQERRQLAALLRRRERLEQDIASLVRQLGQADRALKHAAPITDAQNELRLGLLPFAKSVPSRRW